MSGWSMDWETAMGLFRGAITYISPIFIVTSPITSYADQIYSIHKSRSSAGFSLDIPLIMLVASITKVFYWFGTHYDLSLLAQACLMIVVQVLMLHVALQNRVLPSSTGSSNVPFADFKGSRFSAATKRPYDFWQWRPVRPYWLFLAYFTITLGALHTLFGNSEIFVNAIGYGALTVEATLPLPQIISNHRNASCKGFRLSVLVNWLIGDVFKMSFFFLSESTITWPFKLCGLFQFACDIFLGLQYAHFGEGAQPIGI